MSYYAGQGLDYYTEMEEAMIDAGERSLLPGNKSIGQMEDEIREITELLKGTMTSGDWRSLRGQKEWLLTQDSSFSDGLIALIDAIQDQVVDKIELPEEIVFGRKRD